MFGCSAYRKKVTQYLDDFWGGERSGNLDGQAFTRELIDHYQQTNLSSVFKPIGNEVVRPNVVLVLGTSADATVFTAATRQSSTTVLFLRHLHVLFPPKSLDSLVIHTPAIGSQLTIHARTTEPMATAGDASHFRKQLAFVSRTPRPVTLCRP
jgi:hypothetical protein